MKNSRSTQAKAEGSWSAALSGLAGRLRGVDPGRAGLVVTLIVLCVVFSRESPFFLTAENALNIGRAVAIRGVVAVGMTVVMISGGLDLTISAVMATVGIIIHVLLQAGLPEAAAALLAFGAAVGIGSTNGLLVTKGRITPLIATLAAGTVIRGAAIIFTGGRSANIGTERYPLIKSGTVAGIPVMIIIWLTVCVTVYFVLKHTRFGHYAYAVGGNPLACRVSGIRVDLWRFLMFVFSGSLAGFAGILLIGYTSTALPNAVVGAELDIMAASILGGAGLVGGRGTIIGTSLGIVLMGVLFNGMVLAGMRPYWEVVARGAVLLGAVLLDAWRSGGYR